MDVMLKKQYCVSSTMPSNNQQGYRQQEEEDADTLALATKHNTYWSNLDSPVSPCMEATGLIHAVNCINQTKFEAAVKVYIALENKGSTKAINRLTSRLEKEYFPMILGCLIKEADKANKGFNETSRLDDEEYPRMLDYVLKDADGTGHGSDAAFRLLGAIYNKDNKDHNSRAYDALIQAEKQGSPTAQYYLGHIHENGLGVNKDNKIALDYYRKIICAEISDKERLLFKTASKAVLDMCLDGRAILLDPYFTVKYLVKADEEGGWAAKRKLEELAGSLQFQEQQNQQKKRRL